MEREPAVLRPAPCLPAAESAAMHRAAGQSAFEQLVIHIVNEEVEKCSSYLGYYEDGDVHVHIPSGYDIKPICKELDRCGYGTRHEGYKLMNYDDEKRATKDFLWIGWLGDETR